jgi:calcium-dependent protein kinase
MLKKNTMFEK